MAVDREAQREEWRRQINEAEIVIVPAALYRRSQDAVDFQLHCAKAFDKAVIALEPFGGKARRLRELADFIVLRKY